MMFKPGDLVRVARIIFDYDFATGRRTGQVEEALYNLPSDADLRLEYYDACLAELIDDTETVDERIDRQLRMNELVRILGERVADKVREVAEARADDTEQYVSGAPYPF